MAGVPAARRRPAIRAPRRGVMAGRPEVGRWRRAAVGRPFVRAARRGPARPRGTAHAPAGHRGGRPRLRDDCVSRHRVVPRPRRVDGGPDVRGDRRADLPAHVARRAAARLSHLDRQHDRRPSTGPLPGRHGARDCHRGGGPAHRRGPTGRRRRRERPRRRWRGGSSPGDMQAFSAATTSSSARGARVLVLVAEVGVGRVVLERSAPG